MATRKSQKVMTFWFLVHKTLRVLAQEHQEDVLSVLKITMSKENTTNKPGHSGSRVPRPEDFYDIILDGHVLGTKRVFNDAYDLQMDATTVTLNGHYEGNERLRRRIDWELRGEQTIRLRQNGNPLLFEEGDRIRAYMQDIGCEVTLVEKLDGEGNVVESYRNHPFR